MTGEPILKVNNLGISFSQYTKGLKRKDLKVINDLDATLYAGEILAIVGSSGSGKSLLASAIFGILPENATQEGDIVFEGQVLGQKDKEGIRGKEIALIPQSVSFLDPLQQVGKQIGLSIKDKSKRKEAVEDIFRKYGLSPEIMKYYPFQLSGGMARKVLLATALVSDARVIIADEPTPGLDEASLAEVLKDFRGLADEGRAILMITHDIEAALAIADKVGIFYAGTTLEIASAEDFKGEGASLRHPYTKALNKARPNMGFMPIEGSQPYPDKLPAGCLFLDRCPLKEAQCYQEKPPFRQLREGKVRCFYAT